MAEARRAHEAEIRRKITNGELVPSSSPDTVTTGLGPEAEIPQVDRIWTQSDGDYIIIEESGKRGQYRSQGVSPGEA